MRTDSGENPVHLAINHGNYDVALKFLDQYIDSGPLYLKVGSIDLLYYADEAQSPVLVTRLLGAGLNPDRVRRSRLAAAARRHGDDDIVALLEG